MSTVCLCLYAHQLQVWDYTDCYDKANTGFLVVDTLDYRIEVCDNPAPVIYQ